ncbi:MAG TPA: type II toxin-antitoxin system VapC family toxin [Rhizomicrobium sp.]
MIVLDTNVVSGIMQPLPDGILLEWLDRRPVDLLWLTSVTIMEVRFGIELMAHGRRRRQLTEAFVRLQEKTLQGRILPFDRESAERSAEFSAKRRLAGRPVEFRDVETAGIAAARGATLATRNIRDFDGMGIDIVNPWERCR